MAADQDVSPDFGVLGPLAATVAGSPVPLGSAKTRIVLASLLLRPNRVVSVEELVDRLWDDEPPKGARNAAQSYVMRLRNALGAAGPLIHTETAGYLIEVSPEMIDLGRFRGRIAAAETARANSDAPAEEHELRAALEIWRGTPLSDVPSEFLQLQELQRLTEERLQALERLMEVELGLGKHAELLGELYTLTEENRLRERFWGQLMLALHRSDRQAEALGVYRKVSALLRDELGIDPGEPLRELNQRILLSDQALSTPRPPPAPARPAERVPFQLPADIPDFVGRTEILAQIRELTTRPAGNSLAVPVAVLSGPPGAGKTALAVHAAHQLRTDFPDGQLYVNLRGYSASPPLAATDALARFLRALGVTPDEIPHEVDEQSALLRSLLSGRRVFMVLDNASSPDHVRPLLPSDASCAVLITSRNNLNGLTALSGARRLPVGMVSADEARAMMTNIVGADRVTAEPGASGEFAAACGFLPLGLRIASTNLAGSSSRTIAEYVQQLHPGSRLDAMEIEGDDQAAVRLAFDLSYSTLKPALSRFFRMLSLIPGPDFDSLAGAAVAGLAPLQAQRLLDQLTATNLIGNTAPGRFHFHDLIGEFAAERVREQESADEHAAALQGLFAFYQGWTYSACSYLYQDAHLVASPGPASDLSPPAWEESATALSWLDGEAENLVAMACARPTVELPVWDLAHALSPYLQRGSRDNLWEAASTAALTAAQRFGDLQAQATTHRGLGHMQFQHGRYTEAETHTQEAQRLFHQTGDTAGEARAYNGLATIAAETGDIDKAIRCYEESLQLAEDPVGRSTTLFNLGMTEIHLGRTAQAIENLDRSRELALELDLPHVLTRCVGAVAFNDLWAGRLGSALHGLREALDAWVDLRFTLGMTEIVRNMAETCLEAQRPDLALDLGRRTLTWSREAEAKWFVIGSHLVVGDATLALGDAEAAMGHFEEARRLAPQGMGYWGHTITRSLAAGHRLSGRPAEASALASDSVADPWPRGQARAHLELAAIALTRHDHQDAIKHADVAHRISEVYGYRLDQARAQQTAGAAHAGAGDQATARKLQAQAAAAFEAVHEETTKVLVEAVAHVPPLDHR